MSLHANAWRGVILAAAALSGWACSGRPHRLRFEAKLVALPKLAYLAPLSYSPQYGIFRDLEARPWGPGKVLAAYWRKDFGFESTLKGLVFSSRGPLVVETTKGSFVGVLHHLDASGVTVSSAGLAVETMQPLRGGTERLAVLDAGDASILDLQGGPVVPVAGGVDLLLTADIDGDGQDEVVVHSWKERSLAAYRADGRKIWSKKGFDRVYSMAGGRLGTSRTGVLISGGAADFKANALTAITGAGKVFLSTPLAWSEMESARLTDLGDGPRLVSIGHTYPNDRQILKVSRLGEKGLETLWQVDLNWTSVSALASADLDGDGRREILLGTKNGWILVFSAEGRPLAEKNVLGEITAMEAGDLSGDGTQKALVAVKGIPPVLYAVGVIPDPGPWRPTARSTPRPR
jgi:hypothetical protein